MTLPESQIGGFIIGFCDKPPNEHGFGIPADGNWVWNSNGSIYNQKQVMQNTDHFQVILPSEGTFDLIYKAKSAYIELVYKH